MPYTLTNSSIQTVKSPDSDAKIQHDGLYEVILFNDDVNSMEHVIDSLVDVFGHPEELAVKIMIEAHRRGRAIAEVEARSLAQRHKDQLQSYGLTASIEKVE
ncbi:MAG: ATP-dependent Clp protease adaptor ClpS [Verrucomicrobia bacterium]|jgi:ATP-dependent Clp protease adaptor protein ClpS|nr:ATP-dependent Clp protease adaptor ClpS [Verrucomicrobiota bacterium]